MDKFIKINEVATKYHITKRALRYYEEIQLIKCIRDDTSNYRYYDDTALKRLEQIILLRGIGFSLSEIKEIFLTNNHVSINKIFHNKLLKIEDNINSLLYFKKVVSSIIKIYKEQGAEQVNFQEILKQQVYVNKRLERMIEMSQYVDEVIIVEFGENVCAICEKLINSVKQLRIELEDKYKEKIPLVRIRDIDDLNANEYRIVIKGVTVKNESLENIVDEDKTKKIIGTLRTALIDNINTINA